MKINQKIYEVFFVVIISLTPLLWLSSGQFVLGHDSGFRLDITEHFKNLFYSWNSYSNFGTDWSFFKGFLITQFPELFFTWFTHSLIWGQRLTLVFWFFVMGISMYICMHGFFSKKEQWFLRTFSSSFYMFNYFILQGWFIAERAKFSLYAALPLGFLILYKTLQKEFSLIKGVFLFSVVFFIFNGGGNPPLFGGILITYSILLSAYILKAIVQKNWSAFFFTIKVSGLFSLFVVLTNSYWLSQQVYLYTHTFNSALASTGGIDGILGWENVISKHASWLNILRFQGIPDWYDNPSHPYSQYFLNNPLLIILSFLPFLVILLGFFFKRKRFHYSFLIYVLLFILLISLIFTAGTHTPSGIVYEFFIRHVPGFVMFRSSYYKFAPALFFSGSILISYYLNSFISVFKGKIKTILSVTILLLLLGYNFPYAFSDFFRFNTPFSTRVTIPDYVFQGADYLKQHIQPSERILLLPKLESNLHSDSYEWGYWSLDLLPEVITNNTFVASNTDNNLVDSIYKSIDARDEKTFLSLVQKAGIKKILWRGDILYSDKVTKAGDLSYEKDFLNSLSSVKLEKTIGKWQIYDIDVKNTLPLFSSISGLSQVEGSLLNFLELLPLTNTPTPTWITSEAGINPEILHYISLIVNGTPCGSCTLNAVNNERSQLAMPSSVSFLPWSKLYFLIKKKDASMLKATETSPAQRIDVDISLADKRLVEIWRMAYKDFNSNAPFYVRQNNAKYMQIMNDAFQHLNSLSPQEKNDYVIRLLAYLQLQKSYIQFFNQNLQIKDSINGLLGYMDEKQSMLNAAAWISTRNEERKDFISIPQDANYSLRISPVDLVDNITIDGQTVSNLSSIALTAGEHPVEVEYKQQPNLLNSTFDENEMTLKKGEKKVFGIEKFNNINSYYLHFEYRIEKGGSMAFYIKQNNNRGNLKGDLAKPFYIDLVADGGWHSLTQTYSPYVGAVQVELVLQSMKKDSIATIKNFDVENLIQPSLLFVQKRSAVPLYEPKLTSTSLDPTLYTLSVIHAQGPYVLKFNQTFNNGWKVYLLNNIKNINAWNLLKTMIEKPVAENNHIVLDRYSNGWYITKNGSYTVLVVFQPQIYFYVGLMFSIITLALIGGAYAISKKK